MAECRGEKGGLQADGVQSWGDHQVKSMSQSGPPSNTEVESFTCIPSPPFVFSEAGVTKCHHQVGLKQQILTNSSGNQQYPGRYWQGLPVTLDSS